MVAGYVRVRSRLTPQSRGKLGDFGSRCTRPGRRTGLSTPGNTPESRRTEGSSPREDGRLR